MIIRAGSGMKDDVTKSSLRHSVEQTRSSTWELGGGSEERHSPASEILVVLTISHTGQSQESIGQLTSSAQQELSCFSAPCGQI